LSVDRIAFSALRFRAKGWTEDKMRLRDAIKFSLELFLPEKAVLAVERLALERRGEADPTLRERPASTIDVAGSGKSALGIIEDLDSSQFGGPSFGAQTIALMSLALEEALAMLPQPVDDQCARAIAANILKVAAGGERDPVRLRISAMSALKLDRATAIEAPSVMPPG
jgi:hypothetical protein